MSDFRPISVPLINVDPYFSVWSMADKLTDDFTRHWTGNRQAMTGIIVIDGVPHRFMGSTSMNSKYYVTEHKPMDQKSVKVSALTTEYVFEAAGIELKTEFMTPAFMEDLELLSRPVCFIRIRINSIDGKEHKTKLFFDASAEFSVNNEDGEILLSKNENEIYTETVLGNAEQNVLSQKGDTLTINWGYLHLATPSDSGFKMGNWNYDARYDRFRWTLEEKEKYGFLHWYYYHSGAYLPDEKIKMSDMPMLLAERDDLILPEKETVMRLCIAYDDIKAINYFGRQTDAYWRRNGVTFDEILRDSIENFDEYMLRAENFNKMLYDTAFKAGGEKYAELLSLTYRQAINAHKLIADENGKVIWLSKECNSNGCIGTVDVSYPSMPVFLCFNPELVFGMMRPVIKYARSDAWPHKFAPHDVGTYPDATGQVYSGTSEEGQMPIEECGNMILMTAAATVASQNVDFFKENRDLLQTWCEYLINNAQDPANQLCTDDFTGHLAHNANLSIKGISAIAAYGMLCGMVGEKDKENEFKNIAVSMAKKWKELAIDTDGKKYRLAYDKPESWSMKYNIVWDKLMGMGIFDKDIFELEESFYLTKLNRYGIPLDSRASFTKVDFLMWTAMIGGDELCGRIIDSIWNMANDSPDRYPFTDWYDTVNGRRQYFMNRSVIGGLFIKYLDYIGKLKGEEK